MRNSAARCCGAPTGSAMPRARPGRAASPPSSRQGPRYGSCPARRCHAVTATAGGAALRQVRVRPAAASGGGRGQATTIDCDLLAVSGGWNPTLNLFSQAQGRLRFDERLAAFVPGECEEAVECVGAAAGSFALGRCLAEGAEAGTRAAALCGFAAGEAPEWPEAEDADGAIPGPLQSLSRWA